MSFFYVAIVMQDEYTGSARKRTNQSSHRVISHPVGLQNGFDALTKNKTSPPIAPMILKMHPPPPC